MINLIVLVFVVIYKTNGDFELTLLHTNDVHARVEEFNEYVGACPPREVGKCFGGVARRYSAIEKIRETEDNVLLLDAGDQFMGTMWYDYYKGQAAARFMNLMKYDAMTLGNHEFDNGPNDVHEFIKKLNFPVVTANIDFTQLSGWPSTTKFHEKSTIIQVKGKKIGIIGYVTPETQWLASPGPNITFTSVLPAVRSEIERLKSQGVDILIALGHAGLKDDREVAKHLPDIDIVVGGHSHTFLYTGTPPSIEKPEGPYPIVVRDTTTRLVVQDFASGKYLGYLKIKFDDVGKVKSWRGNPILLNSSFPQSNYILRKVKRMSAPVIEKRKKGIGFTKVPLDGSRRSCRARECNLGNLIADAIAEMNTVPLGLWNAGSIRASIVKKNEKDGISFEELHEAIPFPNTADTVKLKGSVVRQVFEHSVSGLPELKGKFLQVSGFHVVYDLERPVGNRVVTLQALCTLCPVSAYHDVEDDVIYTLVTSNYLVDGGDGFNMLQNYEYRHSGEDVLTMVERYIRLNSPLSPRVEGRIQFIDNVTPKYRH